MVQKIAEESERYQVRTQPVRLLDMERDKLVLTSSESAVGYSTDSLPYGYFMMFDANRVITIYEIATHKIRLISWTLPEFPTHIKLLANHKSFVLYTKNAAYLSDIDTRALEELKSYDDIETSPSGSIIALIRSSSQQKKQYYNLQAVPGDLLLDISVAGTPKLLHAEVSDVKMLYWDNAF